MLLKEGVEMTVRQSPTFREKTDTRLVWLAVAERMAKSRDPANDNTDPPLPPAAAARWPRVFPGL
jgi:hypothetical protein